MDIVEALENRKRGAVLKHSHFELVKEYIRYEDWIYNNVYTKIMGAKNEI